MAASSSSPRFATPRELQDWLVRYGIDPSGWGTGGSKSFADLWAEYGNGESVFGEDPPGRIAHVAEVVIRRGNLVLIEDRQVLATGEERRRDRLPGEKMRPGESVPQAALRCVREELRQEVDAAAAKPHSGVEQPVRTEVRDSPSYPGLPTRYFFYRCEVDVPGLDDGSFDTCEEGDPVARHFWNWIETPPDLRPG